MSDDEFGDLLEGLDNEPQPKQKNVLENVTVRTKPKTTFESLLGTDSADFNKEQLPKKEVNFSLKLEEKEKQPAMRGAGRSTNALNELFGTPAVGPTVLGSALGTNTRRAGGASTLDDLFGTTPKHTTSTGPPISLATQLSAVPQATPTAPQDGFDAGRILRLETELERMNRELEDTKRKKREDEEDLENFWKTKMEVQSKEHMKTLEEQKAADKALIAKLKEEHQTEIERLKANYDRQLENVTSSTSHLGDLVSVVGKVNLISTNIDKIAADVVASTNKVSTEQTALLQIQEKRLKIREEKLADDIAALNLEKLKVQELNLSLKDLVKNQKDENEKEKWRTKEEWNRLKVERQLFKENQERIIENIQKEKLEFGNKLKAFHKDQNELLFRLSNERELLEQEKHEFFVKRDQDIKRIKSEAYELDLKSQQISVADQHVTEMKLVTEAKYRQLQHLESLLTAECAEIERIRNEQKSSGGGVAGNSVLALNLADSGRRFRRGGEEELFGSNNSNQNSNRRSESVRASLKKHYENLEKYAGQKVATVAPQNN